MFKVGDVVVCTQQTSLLVLGKEYVVIDVNLYWEEGNPQYGMNTLHVEGLDGGYWFNRFKLKTTPLEETLEDATIEVGDEIVVTYNQGIYKVVDYHAIVTAVINWGSCKFAAPSKEQGGTGLTTEWTLGKPYIKLFKKKAKKLEIGDEVLIVKGYISAEPTSELAMQDVGKIGPITDMRKSYSSIFNFPCIRVKSYWYAVDAVVPYIDGMDIAKAIQAAGGNPPIPEKPRKIINPRKV